MHRKAEERLLVNRMIFLTRFDGSELVVNCDLIVTIERTPDTVISLTTGQRIMVREAVEEVVARATSYRHRVFQGPGAPVEVPGVAMGGAAYALPSEPVDKKDA